MRWPGRSAACLAATVALAVVAGGALLLWLRAPRPITVAAGRSPEQLVYVRASDDIVNGGALFQPPPAAARPVAIIWIHGWGAAFYWPTYTAVARALAARGYATITANTRMHDIGTVAGERHGTRIRGGGYWGVPSEEPRDVAAWIDLAERLGFHNVILVGHSAGWAAVRAYQSQTQDPRVAGVVLASGEVTYGGEKPDSAMLASAQQLVAQGRGEELLQFPRAHRRYPSYVSAATYLDIARMPLDQVDFFGFRTPNPGVTRVRCPLLAFFATDDVGSAAELEHLRVSVRRQATGPSSVTTGIIQHAEHMYTGEEAQVARFIASWADSVVLPYLRRNASARATSP